MPTLDSVETKYIKAILQGPPGRGKTIAGASFPKPMYIFDFEQRLSSVKNYYKDKGGTNGISFDTYTNFQQIIDKMKLWKSSCPFASIGFDSLTSLGDLIISELIVGKGGVKKVGTITVASIEDYGGEAAGLKEIIGWLKRIPCHAWMTAHVISVDTKELGGKIHNERTLLTGGKKIAATLPGYFDEVINFNTENSVVQGERPKYVCFSTPNGLDFAKTSFDLDAKYDLTGKQFFPEVYGKYFK